MPRAPGSEEHLPLQAAHRTPLRPPAPLQQLPPGQETKPWLLPDPCICLLSRGCSWLIPQHNPDRAIPNPCLALGSAQWARALASPLAEPCCCIPTQQRGCKVLRDPPSMPGKTQPCTYLQKPAQHLWPCGAANPLPAVVPLPLHIPQRAHGQVLQPSPPIPPPTGQH